MTSQRSADTSNVLIRLLSETLVVAVYCDESPTDAEWSGYVDALRQIKSPYRMIIFSSGGGPTTMQRKDLEKVTENQESKVAVVTANRLARGIVTAIRWFGREIKAFEPSKRDEAFVFLELEPSETELTMRAVKEMASELGVLTPLQLTA